MHASALLSPTNEEFRVKEPQLSGSDAARFARPVHAEFIVASFAWALSLFEPDRK